MELGVSRPEGGDGLRRARSLARLLDTAFRVPGLGIRFGLDGLLGLVPGGGDLLGALLSAYIVGVGLRLRAPGSVLLRMLLNIGIDTVVGTLPVLGDLFDIGWKSNVRNVSLLERWLAGPERERRASRAVLLGIALAALALAAGTVALLALLLRLLLGAG